MYSFERKGNNKKGGNNMSFIDDKEKMRDLFELSRDNFLKMYSYLKLNFNMRCI